MLDLSERTVAKGDELILTANILPYTAAETPVEWTSSDTRIATVKDGTVMGAAYGSAVITAKAGDKTATCTVTVKPAIVGAYYFDGWAGTNAHASDPNEPWAINAPRHLTKRLAEEFGGRQPVWGWRDDTQAIMERQIDLAADNGVDFFLYCWYWQNDRSYINTEAIEKDYKHTSMRLHLAAANKNRMRFALLVANHAGAEIIGSNNWESAMNYWVQYFRDPLYMTVDGKPLIVLFGTWDDTVTSDDLAVMQEAAVKAGFKGLSVAGCYANARNKRGFTHLTNYNVIPTYSDTKQHYYSELIAATEREWQATATQPCIPQITSGWDNRPWEEPSSPDQWHFSDDTPNAFKGFVKDAITWMDDNPAKTTKERLIVIYAWNELGEGGWLVPTLDDPEAAKLKKIKELLDEYK
ncbi:MAG: glycoside hydrolase family 99-like domain-containing protein [Bacteroidales bacterium]|nr:glycoside hydrolase family 99-like domain-containing protein [Bacteroidales bacterium]